MDVAGKFSNISDLKENFVKYLEKLSEKNNKTYDVDSPFTAIFNNDSEFKDYLSDVVGLDSSSLSKNIQEIIDDILDGAKTDTEADTDYLIEDDELNSDEESFLVQLLNEVLGQSKVIDALDLDHSGDLSKDEISEFIKIIDSIESDTPEELTFDEISKGVQAIFDGKYDELVEKNTSAVTDPIIQSQSQGVPQVQPMSTGGSAPSGNYTPTSVDATVLPSEPAKKIGVDVDDSMSLDDLNAALPQNDSALQEARDGLAEILSGGGEMEQYKTAMDEAHNAYVDTIAAVNDALAQQVQQKQAEIDAQEKLIGLQENKIRNQEYLISNLNMTINNYTSQKDALIANKSALQGMLSDDMDEGQRAQINGAIQSLDSQISSLNTLITQTNDELAAAETDLNNFNSELTTQKQTLTTLKGGDKGQMGDLQSQVSSLTETNPEIKAAFENYNRQKDLFDSQMTALTAIKTYDVEQAEALLDKTNELISEKTIEQNDKTYSPKRFMEPQLFDENLSINMEIIKNDDTLPYLLIAPEGVDPNEPLPVLFYMHGLGTTKNSDPNSLFNTGPGKIMQDWGMNNFRGYIICPKYYQYWNGPDAEKQLRKIYESFSETHAIDTDRVAIAGHSLGGQGALYMANAMSDIFTSAASLSPYDPSNIPPEGMKVPTFVYSGTWDGECVNYAKSLNSIEGVEGVTIFDKADHGMIPSLAFTQDEDGDNCSDLLQKLFSVDTQYEYVGTKKTVDKTDAPSVNITPAPQGTSYTGGTSGGGGYHTGGGSYSAPANKPAQTKTLSQLSSGELDNQLTSANTVLSQKQQALTALKYGNDKEVSDLEKSSKEKYDKYIEKLESTNKDWANQIKTYTSSINTKDNQIFMKNIEITDAKVSLSKAKADYEAAKAKCALLAEQLSALLSSGKTNDPEVAAKIKELKAEIEQAQKEKAAAKTAVDEATKAVNDLTKDKTILENEKRDIVRDKNALESTIAKSNSELKNDYIDPYNKEKANFENLRNQKVLNAQKELLSAQQRVNEVTLEQKTREINNDIKQKYSIYQEIVDTSSYEQGQFDMDFWESKGYNHAIAKQMAVDAKDTMHTHPGIGCVGYTRLTINKIYGTEFTNAGAAQNFGTTILSAEPLKGKFMKVDLKDVQAHGLPDGAVVIWQGGSPGYTKGDALKYGHGGIAYQGVVYSSMKTADISHCKEIWIPIEF